MTTGPVEEARAAFTQATSELGQGRRRAPDDRTEIVELAADFHQRLGRDARVLAGLPALTRLKWHLASRRLITHLVKVVRYERGRSDPAIVRHPVRRYVVYPYWQDDQVNVPDSVYLAKDEVRLRSHVEDVHWKGGRLVISGDAVIHSVSSTRRWTAVKSLFLSSGDGGRRLRLPARQVARKGSWSGFTTSLDPRRLRGRGGWEDGSWDVNVAMFNAGVFRHAPLKGGSTGTAADPPYHYVTDDVRIVPENDRGRLRLRVETVHALATSLGFRDGELVIGGVLRSGAPEAVVAAGAAHPVSARPDGGFEVTVPLPREAGEHDFTLRAGDREHPLVADEQLATARALHGGLEALAGAGASGYLRLAVREPRLTVTSLRLGADATLTITATHASATAGLLLVGRTSEGGSPHRFPLHGEDGRFEVTVPLAAVPSLAGELPLAKGKWGLEFVLRPGAEPTPVVVAPEAAGSLPATAEVGSRTFTLDVRGDRPVVRVADDLGPDGNKGGTRLREEARRQVAKTGLREAVLFSCFSGRLYADSTRAIHEELARRYPDLEQRWVVADGQVDLPDTVTPVRHNAREWHEAIASSRYLVLNHRLGDWFHRHADQTVLQTWHGTPLKKIGKDVKEVHFAYAPGMRKALAADQGPQLPEWTHLVSPNSFSSQILTNAFGFEGELIETGYPRNDLLYSPDAAAIADRVRARVGVPPGKRIVLYAPTWRDDRFYGRGRYQSDWRLDLDAFRAGLGEDHVLLVRLHPNVVDGPPADELVYDVSAYPDIAELYLAADVLVSDYSSVMFDFANTGRPQLFFTYDLEHYRDTLRGFYFDFEKEAPGPLLSTSADLVEALRSVDDVAREYQDAAAAFRERFCALEDGGASARVVDRVFRF